MEKAAKQAVYNKLVKAFFIFSSTACIVVVTLGGVFGTELIEFIYEDVAERF